MGNKKNIEIIQYQKEKNVDCMATRANNIGKMLEKDMEINR